MTIPQITFVTGSAGTGKTTRLMDLTREYGSQLVLQPHQHVLAMSVMHGSRRRLESALAKHCPTLPREVCTIHSFALALVNRWRLSLGILLPVAADSPTADRFERHGRVHVSFDEVVLLAAELMASKAVAGFIASSYPLFIVDEFQDCTGPTLEFMKSLLGHSRVLLAADSFQLLKPEQSGCPAVDWIELLKSTKPIDHLELTQPRRTTEPAMLAAAQSLRANTKSASATVPVICGYNIPMLATKLVQRFLSRTASDRIVGTCALIAPGRDPAVGKLIASLDERLRSKVPGHKIRWNIPVQEDDERDLMADLGIGDMQSELTWSAGKCQSPKSLIVRDRVERFCRLRGIETVTEQLAGSFARQALHLERAHLPSTSRYQVLTVHGAKNREFDHVFVFWGFKVSPDIEQRRRLLYNAITRARKDCTVLVLGGTERVAKDEVLSLLGGAKVAFTLKRPSTERPVRKAARLSRKIFPKSQ